MQKFTRFWFSLSLLSLIFISTELPEDDNSKIQLTDKRATEETKHLYKNLAFLMYSKYVMFGHQSTDLVGYDGEKQTTWVAEPYRSDVKTATGSYAAVAGYDFFTDVLGQSLERIEYLRNLIIQEYERGQVITFSWHQPNPVSGGGFYDTKTRAVYSILPGNEKYPYFKKILTEIGDFIKSLKSPDSTPIPVIIRPFHELSGSWFWWGAKYCTPDEIKKAYRTVVREMRDTLNIHQVIWAFSPDRTRSEEKYFERYPGDDYVDIIGIDFYWGPYPNDNTAAQKNLRLISSIAKKKNKVAAWTEFGNKNREEKGWWQNSLYKKTLQNKGIHIAYMLTWANFDKWGFVPYKNHPCLEEFREFCSNEEILLNSGMNNIYKKSFYKGDKITCR
ncbi:MAG TPA: glycosyl hydrolase [Bacteroidales bacterium]